MGNKYGLEYQFDVNELVGVGLSSPSDANCRACGDDYASAELMAGRCFSCRLLEHYQTKCRLELMPSRSSVVELIFPTRRG